MLKRSVIYFANLLPPVKQYLNQKHAMAASLNQYEREVAGLKKYISRRYEDRVTATQTSDSGLVQIAITEQDLEQALLPKKPVRTFKSSSARLQLNWVVPAMGSVTGGHTDIFRTINFLESRGHRCKIYFYDAFNNADIDYLKLVMKNDYPKVAAKPFYNADKIDDADAIIATSWETAYPVYNFTGKAKKYYFVQDFEPYFYPAGTNNMLAEMTYKFNLKGLTLGKWLADKLSNDYQMTCVDFDFGVDTKQYFNKKTNHRKEVFCYVRPVSPRRGFEIAILALKQFNEKFPDYTINLMGWDVIKYQIPFPHINHRVLPPADLNDLYNKCAAGIAISFTNMSLIPLEALAAGAIPIVNIAPNTSDVAYSKWLQYSEPFPHKLAEALEQVVTRQDLPKYSSDASEAVKDFEWEKSNSKIEKILRKDLVRNG